MKYKTPWGPIGPFVFSRTYARRLEEVEGSTKESFEQTIDRVLKGAVEQLGIEYNKTELLQAKDTLMSLRGMVAGRFLWQLGTSTVDQLGFMSLMNCAACVVDEPIRPFTWTFDALMLGSGVGYNLQLKHVYSLPKVKDILPVKHLKTKDADFIVPDSRSGWVELLQRILEAYFITGQSFTYSTILVRGAGEIISGFGGTASGPGILIDGMTRIQKVLQGRKGNKLSPIDVLDIMNIIGSVVVAGNVRRSAQIAIGDIIDTNYLGSKNWASGAIPNHRAMSNNSVVVKSVKDIPETFWDGYMGNGEPFGLINLPLSKKVGRLGETQYPDPDVEAYNPCLHPDSLVSTVNGLVKIRDICSPTYVYTMLDGGKLGIAECSASWISKKGAATLTIGTNYGSSITVTPDHKVYTVNRGWVEAQELRIGDTVAHLSRTRRGAAYSGVRLSTQPHSEQVMEHRLVYEGVNGALPVGYDVHHKDNNTYNNDIDNLEALTHSDHAKLSIAAQANNHQVWGPTGNFISGPNSKFGAKTVKKVPHNLRTNLRGKPKIVSIVEGPTTDVYDLTVKGTHNFVAENIVVHNCAEQSLANYETCCLAEIFLPNNRSFEELLLTAKILYRINKHALRLPCHMKETEEVVHRHMRMGIGVTGYLQSTEEQKKWLPRVYEELRKYDEIYSARMGWPTSIKLTTVKPSGSLSLLAGVTPGVHPGFSRYHIRRVRVRTDDPLTAQAKAAGYPVEYVKGFDGRPQYDTSIVSFPCSFPKGTVLVEETSAIDQLEYVKRLQTDWSDNSVSCTVYYKLEELPEIRKWLEEHYETSVKTVSFLLHSDHGFEQAPLEEIDEKEYLRLLSSISGQLSFGETDHMLDESLECAGGHCPVI